MSFFSYFIMNSLILLQILKSSVEFRVVWGTNFPVRSVLDSDSVCRRLSEKFDSRTVWNEVWRSIHYRLHRSTPTSFTFSHPDPYPNTISVFHTLVLLSSFFISALYTTIYTLNFYKEKGLSSAFLFYTTTYYTSLSNLWHFWDFSNFENDSPTSCPV